MHVPCALPVWLQATGSKAHAGGHRQRAGLPVLSACLWPSPVSLLYAASSPTTTPPRSVPANPGAGPGRSDLGMINHPPAKKRQKILKRTCPLVAEKGVHQALSEVETDSLPAQRISELRPRSSLVLQHRQASAPRSGSWIFKCSKASLLSQTLPQNPHSRRREGQGRCGQPPELVLEQPM